MRYMEKLREFENQDGRLYSDVKSQLWTLYLPGGGQDRIIEIGDDYVVVKCKTGFDVVIPLSNFQIELDTREY